jgi:pectinesterase inhibitor-like protein
MMRSAVLVALAAAFALAVATNATVDATCKSAAAGDSRVNLQLCLSQLGHHRESPDADTWGLAKVASLVGVNSADLAADDIKTLEAASHPSPALAQCAKLYAGVGLAFASAQAYAAGKQRLAEAISLTKQCDAAFANAKAGWPSATLIRCRLPS